MDETIEQAAMARGAIANYYGAQAVIFDDNVGAALHIKSHRNEADHDSVTVWVASDFLDFVAHVNQVADIIIEAMAAGADPTDLD